MKTRKVTQYICEFCNRRKLRSVADHEKSCTKNPNRVCRVCKSIIQEDQAPIATLLALLPDNPKSMVEYGYGNKQEEFDSDKVNAALPALREACHNCPACIMAALRQKGIPVPVATDFNFTKEMKSFWDDINADNRGGI